MRKWMKLHDSMCGSVCVRERERGLRPQNKSIFVSDWNHIFHPPVSLSLSLSYSLSLPVTISFRDTETVKKNTQIWTLILRVCPVPVSLLFEHPLRVHTHTHTSLSMSPSGLTSSLNLDISSMCPPTTWDHLVRSESLWEVEQLSHLCPPP